jgi:hypothetical protein
LITAPPLGGGVVVVVVVEGGSGTVVVVEVTWRADLLNRETATASAASTAMVRFDAARVA